MSKEKAKEFFELVRKMREAQKAYFLTRTREALLTSKGYERQVDGIIADTLRKIGETRNPKFM